MSGTWADAGLRVVWTDFPEVVADPIGDALRADAVAYWKLDEASGTRADSTGRGNNLTDASSNVGSASGKVGNCATYTSSPTGKRLRKASVADLEMGGTNFYCAFWLQQTDANAILCIQKQNATDFEYDVNVTDAGLLSFALGGGGYVESSVTLSLNTWYFVEVYYKQADDSYGIAVDNGAFVTGSAPSLAVTTAEFSIGAYMAGIPQGDLKMDEVGIFRPSGNLSTWLTADKRSYLYNSGSGKTLYP